MRPFALVLLSALSLACDPGGAGRDAEEDLSCAFDPHDWWENAFSSLRAADADGHFDYDPYGDVMTGRTGDYDATTGDFAWSSSYTAEYPYVGTDVTGYGTIYANGDLDLVGKSVYEDILGARWAEQTRTKREGCSATVRRSELDVDAPVDAQPEAWAESFTWEVSIVADDRVESHMEMEQEYGLYVTDSFSTPEIASQGTADYADGGYVAESTLLYDGTGTSTWAQYGAAFDDTADFVGTDTYYLNGSTLKDYDIYEAGTEELAAQIELLYLYDGSATGTYTGYYNGRTYTCDVTITVGGESCTMDCGSSGSYDC